MRYRTIVADPPWPITDNPSPVLGEVPYETMSIAEIAALPVKSFADNRDGDAVLYLWTTSVHLFESRAIAEAWGFRYVAMLVWCKPPRGAGMGCPYTSNVEFLLYCRRPGFTSVDTRTPRPDIAAVTSKIGAIVREAGFAVDDVNEWVGASDIASWWTSSLPLRCSIPKHEHWLTLREHVPVLAELDEQVAAFNEEKGRHRKPPTPVRARVNTRWFTWPRGRHSAKPEAFYDMVEQVSPGPYLEMFSRRARLGWDTWGDEALNHIEIAVTS